MLAYNGWANTLAYSSIREQGDAGPDARRLFAHLMAAETIWLSRLLDDGPLIEPWPELTLEQCGRYVRELPGRWSEFIGMLSDAELDEGRSYTNSQGEEFTTKVRDVLQHVLTHSAYHRGQIALHLRALGLTPAVTDYIAYDRRRSET
jgi:uncharacterized damage-inducible protein DinB